MQSTASQHSVPWAEKDREVETERERESGGTGLDRFSSINHGALNESPLCILIQAVSNRDSYKLWNVI